MSSSELSTHIIKPCSNLNYVTLLQECIKPIEMQSNKSKTGAKIKIQSDDLAFNEVNIPNIHLFILKTNYNLKLLIKKFTL